jgi:hypothetical protein
LGVQVREGALGEATDFVTEFGWVMDDEGEVEGDQEPGDPVEVLDDAAEEDTVPGRFEGGDSGWDAAGSFVEGGLEEDFDAPGAGRMGKGLDDVGKGIEIGGAGEGGVAKLGGDDAVETEDADIVSEVAVSGGEPAVRDEDDTVGVDLALGFLPVPGAVAEPDAAALLGTGAEGDEGVAGGDVGGRFEIGNEGGLDGTDAVADGGREDALDLGQRPFNSRSSDAETEATGGEETEGDGEGLIVGEHEGWKFETGTEFVGAVATAFRLDGDTEILEHGDVAADGALIDFEAFGELTAAQARTGLEEFEGGEDAGGWVVHAWLRVMSFELRVPRESGPIMPGIGGRLKGLGDAEPGG